jgi:glycosyltransferase involved in cell wall biosynthesis
VSASRNEAIAAASGKYIALQDADDISDERRLEAQVRFLEENPHVGALGTNYDVLDQAGDDIVATTDVFTYTDDLKLAEIFSNQFGQGTMMIRKKLLNNSYDESLRYAEDYDLWTRLSHITALANLQEVLYEWRLHADSASAGDYMREHSYQVRDREFEHFLKNRREYKFFTFHPHSMRGGLKTYLTKKSSLYRDMALMYSYKGRRRQAIPITLLAAAHAPWQARNYRQFFIIIFRKKQISSLDYEII